MPGHADSERQMLTSAVSCVCSWLIAAWMLRSHTTVRWLKVEGKTLDIWSERGILNDLNRWMVSCRWQCLLFYTLLEEESYETWYRDPLWWDVPRWRVFLQFKGLSGGRPRWRAAYDEAGTRTLSQSERNTQRICRIQGHFVSCQLWSHWKPSIIFVANTPTLQLNIWKLVYLWRS